ncbi:MAG TPA: ATP-binding protein [Phycisphaerae bacterium]|nr:ATP-binding protein [Phycisphaerae bacterium]
MTLKQKILIGQGVTFACMGAVVVLSVANLVVLGRATDAILSENYRSILAAENMVDELERQDSAILLILLGDADAGTAQFHASEAVFLQWLARAKDNITIAGEADLVNAIESDYAAFRGQFAAWRERGAATAAPPDGWYHDQVYPRFAQVRTQCIALRQLNEETMYAASVSARGVARQAIGSTITVAALALGIALAVSLMLAGRIARPIQRLVQASRQISAGDFSVEVPVATDDELGQLASEFNQMAQRLGRYHELNIEQIIAEKNKGDAILASIEDGLVVFDPRLKVTGINPAARRLLDFGFSSETALDCADLLPAPELCALIRRTVEADGRIDLPHEQRFVTLPGGDRPAHCLFSVTAIRGRDRALAGVVLVLRDVTRLTEVERLKSEFVMAASHELRTPLTGLGMSVDLLMEHAAGRLEAQDRDLLQAAHEEVHRMQALVDDLLDLSKVEAGMIALQFESVVVAALFERVKAVFRNQLEMKGVTLTVEEPPPVPAVRADANKIAWVLTNLVSNAIRYVGRGGHIAMRAERVGDHVQLAVRDDGPGIPLEDQSRIFQKFVQVEGQEGGGAGLGLAICREIVRAHAGTIWVESAPGKGSTFTFTLPLAGQEMLHEAKPYSGGR